MSHIVVNREGQVVQRFPLRTEVVTIGRRLTNDIVLISPQVSREHARLVPSGDGWVVEDLGSAYGVMVDGKRIKSHRLHHLDEVQISSYTLTFRTDDPTIDALGVARPTPATTIPDESPTRPLSPVEAAPPREAPPPSAPPPGGVEPAPVAVEPPKAARPDRDSDDAGADDEEDAEEVSRILNQTIVLDPSAVNLTEALLRGAEADDSSGANRLHALFEISKILAEASDFTRVLVAILDKAVSIMSAERGFLMLEDPNTKELRVHVARDAGQSDLEGVDTETISRSLIRRVRETGKPVFLLDAQSKEWGTESILAHSIHSALCVPLLTRNAVTGVIYVDRQTVPIPFSDEDVAFFTTFAVQAKAAIDNSRAFWELVDGLLRASDDFLVVCSLTGHVTQVNRAGCELLGQTEGGITGRRFEDLVTDEHQEAARFVCEETVARGVASGCEVALVKSDGSTTPMSISGFTLSGRDGAPIGFCLIGRDLSEIKSLIAALTQAKVDLERRNRFIRSTFGRYLSDEIVESLLATPEGLELGGEKRKVTILMSDLRGFTTTTEHSPPETVVAMLNHHLGAMTDIILDHQGTIDEFIGDAILAIFGAPALRPDDAARAAACALRMQLAMVDVNRHNRERGLPELQMGIALNTGEVVVGNIGSAKRAKYGVVGRNVNLTSRIESHTVGGQILMSADTRNELGDLARIGARLRVTAKGMREPIELFELRGLGGEHDLRLPEEAHELVTLPTPIRITFSLIEDKQVRSATREGRILRLSKVEAEITSDEPPEPLENIQVQLLAADGNPVPAAVYAKVIPRPATTADCVVINFTSLAPQALEFLRSQLDDGAAAEPEA